MDFQPDFAGCCSINNRISPVTISRLPPIFLEYHSRRSISTPRFYLGLALLQLSGGNAREHEALQYVHEGLEHLLYKLTLQAESPSEAAPNHLHSSTLLEITNVQCLKGFLTLGKVLTRGTSSPPSHFMRADEIFRCVASLAVRALCCITHKGELYHQVEWTLLEAHSCFLQWLLEVQKKDGAGIQESIVATHCDNLCSFLKAFSVPKDSALLQLQEKVCLHNLINTVVLWGCYT